MFCTLPDPAPRALERIPALPNHSAAASNIGRSLERPLPAPNFNYLVIFSVGILVSFGDA